MLTTNHVSMVSAPGTPEWLEAWPLPKTSQEDVRSLLNQAEEEASAKTPRLLLVDDDPIFCRSMIKTAEKKGVELVVCKSIGEVLKLPKETPFDAALLDFQFGELTAYQVGHFLAEDTPIFLVSNQTRSDVHYRDWPFNIRDFFSKSIGNLAILNHAMGVLGLANQSSTATASLKVPALEWRTIASIALTVLAAITYLFYLNLVKPSSQNDFLWDALKVNSSHAVNQVEESARGVHRG